MSPPLIRSGQWSQVTSGILQPAARLRAIQNLDETNFGGDWNKSIIEGIAI